jgi:hypothetical protein
MRIGPTLWSRFTDMIENDDFKLNTIFGMN